MSIHHSVTSEVVKKLKPSATIAISTKAKELKAQGIDVIGLSAGEPDFDTPNNIKEAAIKAIQEGKTKYTAADGAPELKDAIIEKFKRDNEVEYKREEITVGTGAKQVIFNLFMATINQGDEVIIPSPYWVSYPDIVGMFGGKSVVFQTSEQNNFKITADELDSIVNSKTKWLILNSPSNPSGQVYTKGELLNIAEVVRKYPDLHVMSDDIYEYITYSDDKYYTLAQVAPDLQDRIFTLNGVSKGQAMTGWRIGFGAIKNPHVIKSIAKIQSQSTSNPSSISQYAAIEALIGDLSFIKPNKELFQRRRDIMVEGLNKIEGIVCKVPQGAFYAFFSVQGLVGKNTQDGKSLSNDLDIAGYLLEEAKVALVPGSAFGMEGYMRASYATNEELISKAIARIEEAVKKLK